MLRLVKVIVNYDVQVTFVNINAKMELERKLNALIVRRLESIALHAEAKHYVDC